MKSASVGWVVGVLVAACMVASVRAEPPRVVSAVPDYGDVAVDPGLVELTVEFDQDMEPSGRSICGGGETFPQIDGQPKWSGARKIVVPVKLKPGKTYHLMINCSAAKNFRSVKGEAVEVYPISFRTAHPDANPPETAPVLTGEQATGALTKLREAIDERYSYKELRASQGVDWEKLFAEHGPGIESARTPAELMRRVARMLRVTNDLHISVVSGTGKGEFVLGAGSRDVTPNVDVRRLAKMIDGWKALGSHAFGGTFKDVPYLLILDWSGVAAEYEPLFHFIEAHEDAKSFIVDVRPNGGGDENIARGIAACFVEKKAVYSRNKVRDPMREGGWTPVYDREVSPAEESKPRVRAKMAVLTGPVIMSSCESFVLMMKHGAGARLIGGKTWGSTGRPMPVEIAPGVTVRLPSWIDMEPGGEVVEGAGIAPDVEVKFVGREGRDEVLERAVEELKR